jgi:hypothetical protein
MSGCGPRRTDTAKQQQTLEKLTWEGGRFLLSRSSRVGVSSMDVDLRRSGR